MRSRFTHHYIQRLWRRAVRDENLTRSHGFDPHSSCHQSLCLGWQAAIKAAQVLYHLDGAFHFRLATLVGRRLEHNAQALLAIFRRYRKVGWLSKRGRARQDDPAWIRVATSLAPCLRLATVCFAASLLGQRQKRKKKKE